LLTPEVAQTFARPNRVDDARAGPGTLTVSSTTVDHNRARGGAGGAGPGGGVFLDIGSTLTVSSGEVNHNQASTSGDDFFP
jgi:hypothetical protein